MDRGASLLVAVVTAALVAVAVAVVPTGAGGAMPGAAGGAVPTIGETAAATTPAARPADPNDGWFIPAPAGLQMTADELITDPGRLPLYLDGDLADAVVAAGFRRVRLRSYYAGASGGGAFKIIAVDRPGRLLARLDRAEGLGRSYRRLPAGRIRTTVVQMEDTRAHDVFAHFATITYRSAGQVVQIEAYGLNDRVARRRAAQYARAQHALLTRRAG